MTSTTTLIDRNRTFARSYSGLDLPALPKLQTVVLTCGDARVDPAHVLGLDLGDAVVIRNNGGRVTPAFIEELSALAFMIAQMQNVDQAAFEVVLMQHTQCGAQKFADPDFQNAMKTRFGIDVSATAITDHDENLREDVERLRAAPSVPDTLVVSGFVYDVADGSLRQVVAPLTGGDKEE